MEGLMMIASSSSPVPLCSLKIEEASSFRLLTKKASQFPISKLNLHPIRYNFSCASLNRPRGFDPSPKRTKKRKPVKPDEDKEEEDEDEGESDASIIPEVVTNRMISRMGFSVGIPLVIGLLFFPFFYYLKAVLKIDVPMWIPVLVSFIFYGAALVGVSYGIVSSSWDPMREGSLLGWNEAQRNWPVFWRSLWGKSDDK